MPGANADVIHCSVAIMAHPAREVYVRELTASLDRTAIITWDERGDVWDTRLRATLAYDPTATHHLVLQDDAIACHDLIAGFERALAYVPRNIPVSAYLGAERLGGSWGEARLKRALALGSTWVAMRGPRWGVAIAVPVSVIEDLAMWCEANAVSHADDLRITRYFTTRGIDCWFTIPSLVDHRHGPGVTSLVRRGRAGAGRHALRFVGTDVSALTIEWEDGPPPPPEDGYVIERVSAGAVYVCWTCGARLATPGRAESHVQGHGRVRLS